MFSACKSKMSGNVGARVVKGFETPCRVLGEHMAAADSPSARPPPPPQRKDFSSDSINLLVGKKKENPFAET